VLTVARILRLTDTDLSRDSDGQTWLRLGDPSSPVPVPFDIQLATFMAAGGGGGMAAAMSARSWEVSLRKVRRLLWWPPLPQFFIQPFGAAGPLLSAVSASTGSLRRPSLPVSRAPARPPRAMAIDCGTASRPHDHSGQVRNQMSDSLGHVRDHGVRDGTVMIHC